MITEKERFLSHVIKLKNGCWHWSGRFHHHKRPEFLVSKKRYLAAGIVALNLFKNIEVPKSIKLTYLCKDNICVNPDHLSLEKRKCLYENCTNLVISKNLCGKHYQRQRYNTSSMMDDLFKLKTDLINIGKYICSQCKDIKIINEFGKDKKNRWGINGICKLCLKNKKEENGAHLKRNYNLTPEEYNKKLETQNQVCAVCKKLNNPIWRKLSVDHNHETKQIRGLLCNSCNFIIGLAKEDTIILSELIKYLNFWNEKL